MRTSPLLLLATAWLAACQLPGGRADGGPGDADHDGINDAIEGEGDADGDGIPNLRDYDSDGDCLADAREGGGGPAPIDSDGDGFFDFLDADSDDNGVKDGVEAQLCGEPSDGDRDGAPDHLDFDDDDDGLDDVVDGNDDVDNDGLPNRLDDDSDADCIPDEYEVGDPDDPRDTDGDGLPDFRDKDADGDGRTDSAEAHGSCDARDFDGDGTPDYIDDDIDGDGLANSLETVLGTDPRDRDSDGDGASDGVERFAKNDPLDPLDRPDGTIIEMGPRDRSPAGGDLAYVMTTDELDVVLLFDVAWSDTWYHPDPSALVKDLADAMFAKNSDLRSIAMSVATYDDYEVTGWASDVGAPYALRLPMSTSRKAVKSAAIGLSMWGGGDARGSGLEAVWQAMSGHGYDQACDGVYDRATDILPYHAAADDAFLGTAPELAKASAAGVGDGVGFRDGARKVVVLVADDWLRDPDDADPVPDGACHAPVGTKAAADALNAQGAKIVGVNIDEYQAYDPTVQSQLERLALLTDSWFAGDDDRKRDDLAALGGDWTWPDTETLADAIEDVASAEVQTRDLDLVVADDPLHWLTLIDTTVPGVGSGHSFAFRFELNTEADLSADDQFYETTVELSDRDGVVAEYPIRVVIRPPHVTRETEPE